MIIKNYRFGLLFLFYALVLLFFTLYTYSQIDLNLTLFSNSFYQSFQKKLIFLGYFNRPLSACIFTILIFLLFAFYFLFLKMVIEKKIKEKEVLKLIFLIIGLSFFSYPAFSHDIFNYMFDARIITFYGLLPYQYRALDFPNDLWVRFMHWTHRYYPYGPFWLLLTLPFSFFGFSKFTLTLFNFKILFTAFYLGNIFLIGKILEKINPILRLSGIVFFSLNPLIIVESLISPHNESIMLFFLLLAIYFLIQKNKIFSFFSLILSGGVKFLTLVFVPIFYFWKEKDWDRYLRIIILTLLVLLFPLFFLREAYPWYFILLIGVVSLIFINRFFLFLTIGISFGALLRYLPFIYFGDYKNPVSFLQNFLLVISVFFAFLIWLKFKK